MRFHGLFITWRMWAIGWYWLPRKSYQLKIITVAFGPLRLRLIERGPR